MAIARTASWPASDAEVDALVRQVVAQAGGLASVISPGDVVVVKPNLVWGGAPEEGYITDPRVTRTVVALALKNLIGIAPSDIYHSPGSQMYKGALGHGPDGLDRAAYNASGPTPALERYTLLVLENDYLRVTVLPELGGRVYQMVFKPTGHNELYQNPVIKPTPWGPLLLHPERNLSLIHI